MFVPQFAFNFHDTIIVVIFEKKYDKTLSRLHWLPVAFWARLKILVLVYKAVHGLWPHYLLEHLSLIGASFPEIISSSYLFFTSLASSSGHGKRSKDVSYQKLCLLSHGPILMEKVVHQPPLPSFRRMLKTILF